MRSFTNKFWLTGFVSIFLLWSLVLLASSAGKTGRTSLSDTPGCTCHGSQASSAVSVSINGPDTVEIDKSATYTVTISGGPAVAAGTDIAVSGGSLTAVSGTLQKINGELTHTAPVSFGGNSSVVFEFQFTAPSAAGDVILAANGNSVNLNGGTSGDQWNFAPDKNIVIASPNAIFNDGEKAPLSFSLNQNFPNPFNPSTTISYTLQKASMVELSVFDLSGKKIATLVNGRQSSGSQRAQFNAGTLSSGVYLYRLTVDGRSAMKRMMLLK